MWSGIRWKTSILRETYSKGWGIVSRNLRRIWFINKEQILKQIFSMITTILLRKRKRTVSKLGVQWNLIHLHSRIEFLQTLWAKWLDKLIMRNLLISGTKFSNPAQDKTCMNGNILTNSLNLWSLKMTSGSTQSRDLKKLCLNWSRWTKRLWFWEMGVISLVSAREYITDNKNKLINIQGIFNRWLRGSISGSKAWRCNLLCRVLLISDR